VNQSKQQHKLGVKLLEQLGLDYIRLEPGRDGRYRYVAWSVAPIAGNGSPRVVKRGRLRAK
jgi:hypothetical protein